METKRAPVVIIGSGIAGLLTALKLSESGIASLVATKTLLAENSSRMAQGGIAAVIPENRQDSVELHVKDTLIAGAGLSDERIARSILEEGHLAIQDLLRLGVPFDTVEGKLTFTKEAAHTTSRILHAGGDATGRSIQDTLIYQVRMDPRIEVLEECVALKLLIHQGACQGVHVISYHNPQQLQQMVLLGQRTVLATGGIGRLYSQTTNPPVATGDGIALAYDAGAKLQDVEFIQFHPTAFWADGQVRFLVSEALRGEGGILRDRNGRAFAKDYHPQGELAPRDIVTRAIWAQILKDGTPCVQLDITHLPVETIELRFPNILQNCLQYGIDIRRDTIPVAPAAHYGMGGVWVDAMGQTTLQNLYAVGEVVSSGLHGANRLASNSLLECVVLARRVATLADTDSELLSLAETAETFPPFAINPRLRLGQSDELATSIRLLRDLMWSRAGITRNGRDLEDALSQIEILERHARQHGLLELVPDGIEFGNMLKASRLICQSALKREESRGAHYRIDFPSLAPVALHNVIHNAALEEALPDACSSCR